MARLHDPQVVLEDAAFIADTGSGLTEAARRLGFASPIALERWLQREGHHDVAHQLRAHDPIPLHNGTQKQWKGVA